MSSAASISPDWFENWSVGHDFDDSPCPGQEASKGGDPVQVFVGNEAPVGQDDTSQAIAG